MKEAEQEIVRCQNCGDRVVAADRTCPECGWNLDARVLRPLPQPSRAAWLALYDMVMWSAFATGLLLLGARCDWPTAAVLGAAACMMIGRRTK